eukprot:scaffold125082_cov17-Tisochrysis_lutea.AAC.1
MLGLTLLVTCMCSGSKSGSKAVRVAAVRLAAATVEGLHPRDRAVPEVQAEAYALFRQSAKVRGRRRGHTPLAVCSHPAKPSANLCGYPQEHGCVDTQAAGAALISAIARGGGSALWRDGCYYWEEALRLCSAHLSHPTQCSLEPPHPGVAMNSIGAGCLFTNENMLAGCAVLA